MYASRTSTSARIKIRADSDARVIQSLLLAKEDREKRIALLHRLGLASHKPDGILRKPGEAKRTAFIVAGRA